MYGHWVAAGEVSGIRVLNAPLICSDIAFILSILIPLEGFDLFNNILTVCTANICRSPMAEYLLRYRLEQTGNWQGRVSSAGISALVCQPAEADTVALMLSRSIDLSPHRATQLTRQQLRQADLVLVMEKYHLQRVLELDPTARGKTFLLGHWSNSEIADPYQRGDEAHAKALQSIKNGLEQWVNKMGVADYSAGRTISTSRHGLPGRLRT
jgi:protein-tyrosine phosphatase